MSLTASSVMTVVAARVTGLADVFVSKFQRFQPRGVPSSCVCGRSLCQACSFMTEHDGEALLGLTFVDAAVLRLEQACATRTRIFLPIAHSRVGKSMKIQMVALLCVVFRIDSEECSRWSSTHVGSGVAIQTCHHSTGGCDPVLAHSPCVLPSLLVVSGVLRSIHEGRCDGKATLRRSRKSHGWQPTAGPVSPALGLRGNRKWPCRPS
jgi:hypothetical protein